MVVLWLGSEFAPPAPGHDPLETMTQEEYRSEITLNERGKEVIRVDEEGFHYKGEFIADAGEAHRLMVAFLKQNTAQPESEVYYEFSVLNDEYCTEAGGTAPTLSQAIDEGKRYFAHYSQDGLYTLEVRRVEIIPAPY
jgi:hypothetical protein